MIREAAALFGVTLVGVGGLYGYGQYQDLQRSYEQLQKKAHMYETSYKIQTEQRERREKEVKELQKKIAGLKGWTDLGVIGVLGGVGAYAISQLR